MKYEIFAIENFLFKNYYLPITGTAAYLDSSIRVFK